MPEYIWIEKRMDEIDEIIIVLPLTLKGQESDMSKTVRSFGEVLEKRTQLPIIFFDERLSSKAAENYLKPLKMNRKKRTKYIDQSAATLILQSYLDSVKP